MAQALVDLRVWLIIFILVGLAFLCANPEVSNRIIQEIGITIASFTQTVENNDTHTQAGYHYSETLQVRDCIEKNGPDLFYFTSLNEDRGVQLCLLPDGRVGVRIVEKIKGRWKEITGYIKKHGNQGIEGAIEYYESDVGKYGYLRYVKEIWLELIKPMY